LLKLLNIAAPYIALGLAIGRIGCFLNWCCYGLASNLPWAIKVGTDIPRHPTQIYLSLAGFVVFWLLIIIKNSKIKMFSQNLFAWFLIFYSISSFIIDPLRVYPSSQYFLTFSYSQIFDILLFITAILIILSKHLYKTRTY
jgi:phosphatidylglycerol:prolipoprotein diacylglycerol transferase